MLEELTELKDKISWIETKESSLSNSMKTEITREVILFDSTLKRLMVTCMAINKSNIVIQ